MIIATGIKTITIEGELKLNSEYKNKWGLLPKGGCRKFRGWKTTKRGHPGSGEFLLNLLVSVSSPLRFLLKAGQWEQVSPGRWWKMRKLIAKMISIKGSDSLSTDVPESLLKLGHAGLAKTGVEVSI